MRNTAAEPDRIGVEPSAGAVAQNSALSRKACQPGNAVGAAAKDEVAEIEARGEADIVTAAGRVGDELRAEISRLASAATDRIMADGLDDATQQELIEGFISKVGAS